MKKYVKTEVYKHTYSINLPVILIKYIIVLNVANSKLL